MQRHNNYPLSRSSSSSSDTDSNYDRSSGIEDSEQLLLNSLLLSDVERFTAHVGRLRTALNCCQKTLNDSEKSEVQTTTTNNYLQIHSALALVSQSVKDLLFRHSLLFKTCNVLLNTGHLVNSIKGTNFTPVSNSTDTKTTKICTLTALQSLDKLESAIANSLSGALFVFNF
ncbi:hypothetical protein ACQ4LE_004227 [Meloidogyne hapla]|uniref:Biogenesis of lysosome-related organelles complex 1 subunit 3 n=1 Tax=Meloidogyne hapla TaxID=6305 RepID=A0A1I8BPG9_MELHA